ncbi:uncharacterized protein DUF4446 [Anaerobacterium chartisolvens]|uniref:Uncharacterized protein DUF4446 n=1 Tax=Anaerobacterium chartisolvens TaxID=1297424 RepID=A0A369B6F2_9FIRM|nr:DUF4446 family protein [Anaerobacterium chartisolvens]RCX16126.1 uncharacterized protein DUF4446 [Anaerobacterium chartisolvens]
MEEIFKNISMEFIVLASVSVIFIIILFLMNMSNRKKIKLLNEKYFKLTDGVEDINVEQILDRCITKIGEISAKGKDMENKINNIERNLMRCIQKIGVVRYNAFENVGSDLSFSIAMLDNNDNGLIISGIYSRETSFTYAKAILSGKSKYALSAEEIQCLEIAKKSSMDWTYTEK